jgi:uncharacterized protein
LLLAGAAGAVAAWLHLPLPWMLGPLLCTAGLAINGVPLAASQRLRDAGQWAIGTALGLYFTAEVLATLGRLSWAIALGVLWALALGYGFYRFLAWRHRAEPGLHPGSAFFATAIGGASEMALLAERHGAQVDRVAAAHSLRVLMVVVLIPFGFQFSGLHGLDAMVPAIKQVNPAGLALLTALTVSAGLLLRRWGLPSPFVLGALAVTMALTSQGGQLSALPQWATNTGQLFIGVALGSRFTPDFLHSGPRWLRSVALGTLGMMGLSIGFALMLAWATGLHPATLILGTSPGGISEMSITAKVLQLGVPVVTGFHVVRYAAVLLLTGWLWRLEQARLQRRR